MPYYICEFCNEPIKVNKLKRHRKKAHPNETPKESDFELLKKVLKDAKDSDPSKGRDPLSLWFEVAKRVFLETEGIDTSEYAYIYDYQLKDRLEKATATSHPPYPPIMIHLKPIIKNQKVFDQFLKEHKGTKTERALKKWIKGIPVIIVCKENYDNLVSEWRRKGIEVSNMMFLTVFFYLHEMYHLNGYGERDADIKAANAIFEIFGQRIVIPDYEIERWQEYEEFMNTYKKIRESKHA